MKLSFDSEIESLSPPFEQRIPLSEQNSPSLALLKEIWDNYDEGLSGKKAGGLMWGKPFFFCSSLEIGLKKVPEEDRFID